MLSDRWDSGLHGDFVESQDPTDRWDSRLHGELARYRELTESYGSRIGNDLWGTSSKNTPFTDEQFEGVLKREVPSSCGKTPGLTGRLAPLRQPFINDVYCADKGCIPAAQRMTYECLCHHCHPGLCSSSLHEAAVSFHRGLHRVVSAWPAGTLFGVRSDYFDVPDPSEGVLAEEIIVSYYMKGMNTKDGFRCARVKSSGPYNRPNLDFETERRSWKFTMSQQIALDVVPAPDSENKFLHRCVAMRFDFVEATRGLPTTIADATEVSRSVLHPLAAAVATDSVGREKDVVADVAARKFHDLLRKGLATDFRLDEDPHGEVGEDQEDEIQVARLEQVMGSHIRRERLKQRKRRLKATGRKLLPRKRKLPGAHSVKQKKQI